MSDEIGKVGDCAVLEWVDAAVKRKREGEEEKSEGSRRQVQGHDRAVVDVERKLGFNRGRRRVGRSIGWLSNAKRTLTSSSPLLTVTIRWYVVVAD